MVDQPPPLVRPVPGAVSAPFTYVRARPFVAGRRRVVRLRAPRGAPVRAPCRGTVRFAGRTPAGDVAVAVRCGTWSATVIGLAVAERRPGARVDAGTRIGRADGRRSVGLGLRRAGDPFGYVDPLPLLHDPAAPRRFVPLGPAPRGRAPAPRSAPVPSSAPAPVPRAVPAVRSAPARRPRVLPEADAPRVVVPAGRPVDGEARVPVAAWAGLALAALGLPAGVLGRRRALRTGRRVAATRPAAR